MSMPRQVMLSVRSEAVELAVGVVLHGMLVTGWRNAPPKLRVDRDGFSVDLQAIKQATT